MKATELTIHEADNGIMLEGEEFVQVIENTHDQDGVGYDNLITELGKLMRDLLHEAMNEYLANSVKVKIEITKTEE